MDSRHTPSLPPQHLALCIASAVAAALIVKFPLLGLLGTLLVGPVVYDALTNDEPMRLAPAEEPKLVEALQAELDRGGRGRRPESVTSKRIRRVAEAFVKTRAVVLATHELSPQRRTDILAALVRARAEVERTLEQQRAVEEALVDGVPYDPSTLDALRDLTKLGDARAVWFEDECARVRTSLAALTLDACESEALDQLARAAEELEAHLPARNEIRRALDGSERASLRSEAASLSDLSRGVLSSSPGRSRRRSRGTPAPWTAEHRGGERPR